MHETAAPVASAEEIVRIAGVLDETVIARIQATGATVRDVLQAYLRLTDDDAVEPSRAGGSVTSAAADAVYGILGAEFETPDEE
jgi:hypothetical protein